MLNEKDAIAKVFNKVTPEGHGEQILSLLKK